MYALLAGAVACLVAAYLILRSLGPRYRVARLLSATPQSDIEEALNLASGKRRFYVRVTGRITSDEEFPDENDRPLVFRRKRIQVGDGRGWRTVNDEREAVPFGVETRSDFIAIDEAAIDDGLVAIPREAAGGLGDLPPDYASALATATASQTPARLLVEQLSAVEHATVCGVPMLRDGEPVLTSGLGRPLIVTTLDVPAAMRLLASGNRTRVVAAGAMLVVALVLMAGSAVALFAGL